MLLKNVSNIFFKFKTEFIYMYIIPVWSVLQLHFELLLLLIVKTHYVTCEVVLVCVSPHRLTGTQPAFLLLCFTVQFHFFNHFTHLDLLFSVLIQIVQCQMVNIALRSSSRHNWQLDIHLPLQKIWHIFNLSVVLSWI